MPLTSEELEELQAELTSCSHGSFPCLLTVVTVGEKPQCSESWFIYDRERFLAKMPTIISLIAEGNVAGRPRPHLMIVPVAEKAIVKMIQDEVVRRVVADSAEILGAIIEKEMHPDEKPN